MKKHYKETYNFGLLEGMPTLFSSVDYSSCEYQDMAIYGEIEIDMVCNFNGSDIKIEYFFDENVFDDIDTMASYVLECYYKGMVK